MIPILGIILGLVIGIIIPFTLPGGYSIYIAVGILAVIDSVLGASVASLRGMFDIKLFLTGFFGNLLIALALSFVGEQLGLPLYYVALFAFGNRLFSNFGVLRRLLIDKYSKKHNPNTKIN